MTIGLTGGSGTGKSTATEFFKNLSFEIIDLDTVARDVCKAGSKCLDEIKIAFGNQVIAPDGTLLRKKLGEIVFADSEKLKVLNNITHKYIIEETMGLIEKNKDKNIVLDAPLLFESGLDKWCDTTICILSQKQNRINRIVLRDGISSQTAQNRIASQPDDSFYIEHCTEAIYNDGTTEELLTKLKKFWEDSNG